MKLTELSTQKNATAGHWDWISFSLAVSLTSHSPAAIGRTLRIERTTSISTEHAKFYQFLMSQSDGSSVRYKLHKPHKFRLDHNRVSFDFLCVPCLASMYLSWALVGTFQTVDDSRCDAASNASNGQCRHQPRKIKLDENTAGQY